MNRFSFIVVLGTVVLALAGSAQALSVSPGRTEIHLTPGKKVKADITIVNDSKLRQHIDISTKDWFVLPENKNLSVAQWLKVKGKSAFWLEPGQDRKIPLVVECPKHAQGELVAMVSFLYQGEEATMVTPVISVSVYMEADGTEKVNGTIKEVAISRWKDKLLVGVAVNSTGNVHLRPTGQVSVVDGKGQSVAVLPVREGGPTYPGRVQGYPCEMPKDLTLGPGHYTALASLTYRDLKMDGQQKFQVLENGNVANE